MGRKVNVIGVGMVKFAKPGKSDDYNVMGANAIKAALKDAGIDFGDIEQAHAGYVYGDSTCGQRAVYDVGLTGIPVFNVNNNCSTGSTAVYMAKQFIQGGNDCVLAFGFEKMQRGSLGSKYDDRTNPMDQHMAVMMEERGFEPAPPAPQVNGSSSSFSFSFSFFFFFFFFC